MFGKGEASLLIVFLIAVITQIFNLASFVVALSGAQHGRRFVNLWHKQELPCLEMRALDDRNKKINSLQEHPMRCTFLATEFSRMWKSALFLCVERDFRCFIY